MIIAFQILNWIFCFVRRRGISTGTVSDQIKLKILAVDYVFFERESKPDLPEKNRRFPPSSPSTASASHHFFGQITN